VYAAQVSHLRRGMESDKGLLDVPWFQQRTYYNKTDISNTILISLIHKRFRQVEDPVLIS
jgi:hypothetical protein